MVQIGYVTAKTAENWGFTGVMLRGSGVRCDFRKTHPYEIYSELNFIAPVHNDGDCFARYVLRMEEMRQALIIIKQSVSLLETGPVRSTNYKFCAPNRLELKNSMEAVIHHFKFYTEGLVVKSGETYSATEAPKGEFAVYLVSDNTGTPFRCKIKAPGFAHLQALDTMVKGHMVADIVTIIGTQDIVFGEIDR